MLACRYPQQVFLRLQRLRVPAELGQGIDVLLDQRHLLRSEQPFVPAPEGDRLVEALHREVMPLAVVIGRSEAGIGSREPVLLGAARTFDELDYLQVRGLGTDIVIGQVLHHAEVHQRNLQLFGRWRGGLRPGEFEHARGVRHGVRVPSRVELGAEARVGIGRAGGCRVACGVTRRRCNGVLGRRRDGLRERRACHGKPGPRCRDEPLAPRAGSGHRGVGTVTHRARLTCARRGFNRGRRARNCRNPRRAGCPRRCRPRSGGPASVPRGRDAARPPAAR